MGHKRWSFLLDFLYSLWWGGLTFYAAVVVHIGFTVLKDHKQMGVITQQVTNYLNAIGVLSFLFSAILFFKHAAKGNKLFVRQRIILGVLIICQVALIYVHSVLSDMINTSAVTTIISSGFYNIHRIYLWITIVMWVLIPWQYYNSKKQLTFIS